MDTALHFRRFEFKYLLNKAEESRIKRYLARYMVPDPQAHKTGSYEVVSLYFDSPAFYYYHEKTDGIKKRKKIRERILQMQKVRAHRRNYQKVWADVLPPMLQGSCERFRI